MLQNIISGFWARYKNRLTFIFVFFVLAGLSFVAYKNWLLVTSVYNKTQVYLAFKNDSPNSTVSFSNFFTTIGASILGVLAITFSLSLFALQQAADKYTPNVLTVFLKDKTNLSIFWSIAVISIIFFIMAILPLSEYLLLELVVGFILLIFTFFLIRIQYFHIIKVINPTYQIILQHNDAIKALDKVDKWLNLMIKIGAIRQGNSNDDR